MTPQAAPAQSHGPVTPEGKATSSMNALRHGLCSQRVVLPGEDQSAFDRLRQDYLDRFRPQGPAEIELVETLAASSWRLKRIIRLETALLSGDATDPCKALSLLIRYENQLNRSYTLAMQRLEALQQSRAAASKSPALRNEPTPLSKSISERDIHHAIAAALTLPEPLSTTSTAPRTSSKSAQPETA